MVLEKVVFLSTFNHLGINQVSLGLSHVRVTRELRLEMGSPSATSACNKNGQGKQKQGNEL